MLVRSSLETLPRQSAAQEVHEDVAERLQVVSSRLLASKMGVDTHVSSRAGERFAFPVRNVLLGLGVAVLLRHAEVHNVDNVGSLRAGPANQEVIWLDIPVDQILLVDGLYPRQLGHVRGCT